MGGSMPADPEPNEREPNEPEPNEPEPNKLETAADDAIDSALVGIMTGAAEGTAGAKPAEGAAASCAAEAGAVLLQFALGALEAELNVHPLVLQQTVCLEHAPRGSAPSLECTTGKGGACTCKHQERKEKEKFTLHSDHDGRLLRRQPGACKHQPG